MSAALDAAATVAIYLAWAVVILGGVIAIAAFASRWGLPNLPRRREERPVEATKAPPATTRSPAFAFPERPPAFDADAEYRRAIRRAEIGRAMNAALDEKILDRLYFSSWRTAEEIGADLRGGGRIDGQTVGARLRSLRHRGVVVSRTAPDGYRCEWRRAS